VGYNGAFLVASGVATIGLATLLFAPPKVPARIEIVHVTEIEPPGE
jgi:hypothetical protein